MKHSRTFTLLSVLVALGLFVAGCAPAAATPPPVKYKVRVLFPIPVESFESVPQVVAMRMGYFAEEGVEVTYEGSGTVTGEGTKLISEGQADFTIIVLPALLASRAAAMPMKSVFVEREEYIFDFAVRPDSGIESIADLNGRKLGIPDSTFGIFFAPLLIAGGADPAQVEQVVVGMNGRAAALQSGQVDAVLTWIIEEDTWRGRGVEFNLLKGSQAVTWPSNSWVTSEKIIQEQPEMVVAVLRAIAKARLFLKTNPAAAAEMVLEQYPAISTDWETALISVQGYATPAQPQQEANGFGFHDTAAWGSYIDAVSQMEIFPPMAAGDVLTNEFIQAVNDFDHEAVIEQAQNYQLKPEHKP